MNHSTATCENIEREYAEFLKMQRAEILSGKITVRWSQACCGYRLRSGRSAVPGVESFMSESDAWDWLLETHGIAKPNKP